MRTLIGVLLCLPMMVFFVLLIVAVAYKVPLGFLIVVGAVGMVIAFSYGVRLLFP